MGVRDRERGVPRYCTFRRLFHISAPKTLLELTGGDAVLAKHIEDVYHNDIEKVDLMVCILSKPLPKGFGSSDTAFRVFVLMASRRLQSDWFLAGDGLTPAVKGRTMPWNKWGRVGVETNA
jgi:hypothetical protein